MAQLVNQPTLRPSRKFEFGAIWGLITATILVGVRLYAPDMEGPVLDLLSALEPYISVGAGMIAAYFTRNRAGEI